MSSSNSGAIPKIRRTQQLCATDKECENDLTLPTSDSFVGYELEPKAKFCRCLTGGGRNTENCRCSKSEPNLPLNETEIVYGEGMKLIDGRPSMTVVFV